MRVLVSAYSCGPGYGSEPGNGWNWSAALADAGHEVTVLTQPDLQAEVEAAIRRRTDGRLRMVYVPTPTPSRVVRGQIGVYARYLAWQMAAYRVAKRLLASEPFDLAHHITWGSLQLGTWLGLLPIPLVFGPVGGGQVAPRRLKEFHAGDWRTEAIRTFVTRGLIPPFAHVAARRASVVLANNPETARMARRLGARNVQYLSELGLTRSDISDSPAAAPEGPTRLLWVGRLMPRKGLPLALRAVAEANRATPLRLTVLGSGPQSELLEEWVNDLGIADIVDRPGHVPLEVVQASYRSSDALLFTSLRDSTGAQLLEAMAVGLPVITLNHSGAGVLVDQTRGLLVDPSDAQRTVSDLAASIERLARDQGLRMRLGEGALRYARTQIWSAKAEQMTSIYESAIAGRTEPGSLGMV